MNNILLYVVYHDDISFKICYDDLCQYPWIRFIKIETTKYCESIFFDYLLEHYETLKDYDFVGMITYSFASKIELSTLLDAHKNITEGKFNDFDIIGLRQLKYTIGDESQIGITKHLVRLLNKVGFLPTNEVMPIHYETPIVYFKEVMKIPNSFSKRKAYFLTTRPLTLFDINASSSRPDISKELQQKADTINCNNIDWNLHLLKIIPFYSNYWLMKPQILRPFLQWARLVKDIIDNDPVLAYENSNYKANSQNLIPIFNHPWMTWHPFIMERLVCIYAYMTNARIHTYESQIKVRNNKKVFGTFN